MSTNRSLRKSSFTDLYRISLALLACMAVHPGLAAEYHEAVVVGSGYGGAVSALRLGEAGIETVVYEKGRRWTIRDPGRAGSTFADSTSPGFAVDARTNWLLDRCPNRRRAGRRCGKTTGIMERIGSTTNRWDFSPAMKVQNIAINAGVGVGGGSLVNNGMTYRPLREGWELGYDLVGKPFLEQVWNDLDAIYFDRAESVLQASPIPEDILATDYYESTRMHRNHFLAAGYPMTNESDGNQTHGTALLPLIMDWQAVREEISGERTPSAIVGAAWGGMNSGAKFSLDKQNNYLGQAEATGNVTIKPLHTVADIRYDVATELYVLSIVRTNSGYRSLETLEITTPHLIVAAGSIGTTKLMMQAKHTGGLPDLNQHVGTLWGSNANTTTLRYTGPDAIGQGGPAGAKVTNFDNVHAPLVIENLASADQRTAGVILTFAIGVPTANGSFYWDASDNSVNLNWPANGASNIYQRFYEVLSEVNGSGFALQSAMEVAQGQTAHPLGGMPLGLATDSHCQVENYTHLYAIDGSILHGNSALANPSLLITALAERCIDRAVDDILANINGAGPS